MFAQSKMMAMTRASPSPGLPANYYLLFVLVLVVVFGLINTGFKSCFTNEFGSTTEVVHQSLLWKGASVGLSLCETNPYIGALQESLDEISSRMDLWLVEIGTHYKKAKLEIRRDHGRFSPFDAMAQCTEKACVGGPCGSDTSKIVCGMKELTHIMSSLNEKCIVYSIGSNNQWEFEAGILQETPCEVHTFDCTGPVSRFRKPENDRLKFHHVCLGPLHEDAPSECVGKAKCGKTWTLLEIQQYLGHKRIDLFKMDIEGYEWPLFESWPQLLDSNSPDLVLPFQILVEIHYRTQFADLLNPGETDESEFRCGRDMVNLQAHLLHMGYIVVERDDNQYCPHCTELTLVRARCHHHSAGSVVATRDTATSSTLAGTKAIAATDTSKKLMQLGVTPLYNPKVTDPWKVELFQRLDRIRVACRDLCNLNTVEKIVEHSVSVPSQQLPMVVVPDIDCHSILSLEEIDASDVTAPAIPEELLAYFTLNNSYTVTGHERLKDMGGEAGRGIWVTGNVWHEDDVNALVKSIGEGTAEGTYGVGETNTVRDKLGVLDMKDKHILVIGSQHPWVEAICLHHGAAHITTLEYGKLVSKHPKITTMTPDEFRAKYSYLDGTTLADIDGVVTHSSIEHSGLGRYGDALNPWGDILAVARAWCVTKPGGFMYLGIPDGQDLIVSNWHRVYGKLRLPLVTANWQCTDGCDLERDRSNAFEAGGHGFLFRKVDPGIN
jgi:Caenorhabditis protein of unknown function, DUF268/Methyltransferase domain